ncbi:MAG: hypothetical protein P8Y23_08255 [Candidatus Lokiarchaeota archaeon]
MNKHILIITGTSSYPIISKLVNPIKKHYINVYKAPITISAFLTKDIVMEILKKISLSDFDLILLPGFVQWDAKILEDKYKIELINLLKSQVKKNIMSFWRNKGN